MIECKAYPINMHKKLLLLPIIALTVSLSLTYAFSPVVAATPVASSKPSVSPSPSIEPISDKVIMENLKKYVEKSGDESETAPTSSARAFIGIVKDVIKDTVIIEDKDGKKDIKLADNTVIIRSPGNATIKPENIRIDDYIIAIGYPESDSTLTGRRLIVSIDPIKPPSKTSGIGTIEKIGKTNLTLKLSDKNQVVNINSKTIYKSAAGTIELTDLNVGDTLIYTATVAENEVQTASVIMRTNTASISE